MLSHRKFLKFVHILITKWIPDNQMIWTSIANTLSVFFYLLYFKFYPSVQTISYQIPSSCYFIFQKLTTDTDQTTYHGLLKNSVYLKKHNYREQSFQMNCRWRHISNIGAAAENHCTPLNKKNMDCKIFDSGIILITRIL